MSKKITKGSVPGGKFDMKSYLLGYADGKENKPLPQEEESSLSPIHSPSKLKEEKRRIYCFGCQKLVLLKAPADIGVRGIAKCPDCTSTKSLPVTEGILEKALLDRILYIGEEVPEFFTTDKRPKFILLGTPQELISYLESWRKGND